MTSKIRFIFYNTAREDDRVWRTVEGSDDVDHVLIFCGVKKIGFPGLTRDLDIGHITAEGRVFEVVMMPASAKTDFARFLKTELDRVASRYPDGVRFCCDLTGANQIEVMGAAMVSMAYPMDMCVKGLRTVELKGIPRYISLDEDERNVLALFEHSKFGCDDLVSAGIGERIACNRILARLSVEGLIDKVPRTNPDRPNYRVTFDGSLMLAANLRSDRA